MPLCRLKKKFVNFMFTSILQLSKLPEISPERGNAKKCRISCQRMHQSKVVQCQLITYKFSIKWNQQQWSNSVMILGLNVRFISQNWKNKICNFSNWVCPKLRDIRKKKPNVLGIPSRWLEKFLITHYVC